MKKTNILTIFFLLIISTLSVSATPSLFEQGLIRYTSITFNETFNFSSGSIGQTHNATYNNVSTSLTWFHGGSNTRSNITNQEMWIMPSPSAPPTVQTLVGGFTVTNIDYISFELNRTMVSGAYSESNGLSLFSKYSATAGQREWYAIMSGLNLVCNYPQNTSTRTITRLNHSQKYVFEYLKNQSTNQSFSVYIDGIYINECGGEFTGSNSDMGFQFSAGGAGHNNQDIIDNILMLKNVRVVYPENPPVINYFNATNLTIMNGTSTMLFWNVTNATISLTLNNGIGNVTAINSTNVTPTDTTTYTLNATNTNSSVYASLTITVNQPCMPDYYCGTYNTCTINNTRTCNVILDNNLCGIPFAGNTSNFTTSCTYQPIGYTPSYETQDSQAIVIDGFAKFLAGWGLVALLIGFLLAILICITIYKKYIAR